MHLFCHLMRRKKTDKQHSHCKFVPFLMASNESCLLIFPLQFILISSCWMWFYFINPVISLHVFNIIMRWPNQKPPVKMVCILNVCVYAAVENGCLCFLFFHRMTFNITYSNPNSSSCRHQHQHAHTHKHKRNQNWTCVCGMCVIRCDLCSMLFALSHTIRIV